MKNLSENLRPLNRSRQKEFLEISLCDHGNLRKLTIIQADQLFHCTSHFTGFCYRRSLVRKLQYCICLLNGHALSPFLWSYIFWISGDFIWLSMIQEGQFHKSRCLGLCILAPKHPGFPHLATGFPKKRKSNRIKNRGFTSSCISCDQIKPHAAKCLKGNLHSACIGTKRTHHQF